MPTDLNPTLLYRALEIAAIAGFAWATLKGLKRDVNGLGKKVRDQHESDERSRREQRELEDRRFFAIAMVLMCSVKEEDRRLFGRWLMQSNRGNDGT